MPVPKCKGCPHLFKGEAMSDDKILYTRLKKVRGCKYPADSEGYPVIESKDFRTSPQWCPLRNNK